MEKEANSKKAEVERAKIRAGKVYQDTYKMSAVGGGYMVSIPKILVERKAKEAELTTEEFKKQYRIIAFFDKFDEMDIAYKFIKKEKT